MGNNPIQCEYKINMSTNQGGFTIMGGRLTGPDVNGDGEPDQLQPATLSVTFNDKEACERTMKRKFGPLFKGGFTLGSNRFTVDAQRLTALSTKGMEKVKGLTWKVVKSPMFSFGNSLMVMIGIADMSQAAYGGYEGKPNVDVQDNSYDDTKIEENPDGSFTVRSKTVIDTKTTTSGKLARSDIEVDDIADSQLREAFKIPTDTGKLGIGSKIEIIYYKGVPDKVKETCPRKAIKGNTLTATVLNITGIHYVEVNGVYKLLPAVIGLDVAPKGEDDILKTIDIDLVSEDYSIRIVK